MTQEQNLVEKMIKGPNNPIPESYAESNAACYIELILWHKYKTREKGVNHSSID